MKELISIQSELNAPKNQTNKFGGYKYRSCEDILAALKPLLSENNCTLTISDDIVMVGNRIYIKATAVLANSANETVSTTAYAREEESKKGMDASQVTGASSSYARKYALNGLFAIDDTKDADTLNNSKAYTQPQPTEEEKDALACALQNISQLNTKDELRDFFNDWRILQNNPQFLAAMSERKKQLGIR